MRVRMRTTKMKDMCIIPRNWGKTYRLTNLDSFRSSLPFNWDQIFFVLSKPRSSSISKGEGASRTTEILITSRKSQFVEMERCSHLEPKSIKIGRSIHSTWLQINKTHIPNHLHLMLISIFLFVDLSSETRPSKHWRNVKGLIWLNPIQ